MVKDYIILIIKSREDYMMKQYLILFVFALIITSAPLKSLAGCAPGEVNAMCLQQEMAEYDLLKAQKRQVELQNEQMRLQNEQMQLKNEQLRLQNAQYKQQNNNYNNFRF